MVLSQDAPASTATVSTDSTSRHAANDGASTEPTPAKKLHGRAFYESIGCPKFVLAPMVDQSEFVRPLLISGLSLLTDSILHRHGVC
jgi:hypothetical protein